MIALGVDPGIVHLGLCILEVPGRRVLWAGEKNIGSGKFSEWHRRLEDILEDFDSRWPIGLIGCEEPRPISHRRLANQATQFNQSQSSGGIYSVAALLASWASRNEREISFFNPVYLKGVAGEWAGEDFEPKSKAPMMDSADESNSNGYTFGGSHSADAYWSAVAAYNLKIHGDAKAFA